ncbi:type VI secretion system tip protein VgrG [Collimonas silvisoli]|uniref:type VI secretion system tip protein VgrG n=1 Tax=Collimonas silvisoli TaxID=2825884 RepID=UPI001B8C15EC|nr:type VI secretion system tip protein VgrG [Collimonas silvisoli]
MFNTHRTLSVTSSVIPELMGQPALTPVSLVGTEGINTLFDYKLTLKTPDTLNHLADKAANFNLDDFIGRQLTATIALEGGNLGNAGAGTREITGLISAARALREEGRHVLYELTLRPWLYLATLTSDCRIFQDMTVVELLDSLLVDYAFPLDKRLIESYPQRDHQAQYNESDYAFFCRLCEENGISWFFEHSVGAHRLVLIDSMGAYKKFAGGACHVMNFHAEGKRIDEETIHAFVPARSLTSGKYSSGDYDYTRPRAELSASRSNPRPTAQNRREMHQWHAAAHYSQLSLGNIARIEGSTGGRDPRGGSFELLVDGHAAIRVKKGPLINTALQSRHVASGEHIASPSGRHLGQRLLASVKNRIKLFSYKARINPVAATGNIDIQALQHSINLLTNLNIAQTANRIAIQSPDNL